MPMPPRQRIKQELSYRCLPLRMCKPLVLRHHYSKRMPASVMLCYGLVDYGPPKKTLACCLFSTPTGRSNVNGVWELTRLVRLPSYKLPLTQLVSKALKHIRKEKLVIMVISFADAEEDHHGGIYQACSWIYHGMRGKRLDGINIDGQFVPARTCNTRYSTSSPSLLRRRLHAEITPHFDIGKHCYWKPISKQGMQLAVSLGFHSRPYPKPMLLNGALENYSVDQQHRKGIVDLPANIASMRTSCVDMASIGKNIECL